MFDITALGELLIDFTPHGFSESGNPLFERNPGGAPANLLSAASKLGAATAFIGKVGNDAFGRFLAKTLEACNINTSGLKFSDSVNTTLAFVHLDEKGDRSFSFYRNPGADMMLEERDIDESLIKSSRIFHFGSLSMTGEPARSATLKALEIAKDSGAVISFDPNLRPPLWKSLDDARAQMRKGLEYANILKISEEELEFLTGEKEPAKGTEILLNCNCNIALIIVTLGPSGAFFRAGSLTGRVPTYDVKVVDTTGAGDAFLGGALYKLKGLGLEQLCTLSKKDLEDILSFANAVGALTTTKRGGIPAVPGIHDVERCMKEVPRLGKGES
ncbi:MAG: PfkB family carbohydrate kinase [Bacillota bacterium]